jgi:hypothetical protein
MQANFFGRQSEGATYLRIVQAPAQDRRDLDLYLYAVRPVPRVISSTCVGPITGSCRSEGLRRRRRRA